METILREMVSVIDYGLSEVTPFADDTILSQYEMISYTSWKNSRRNSMKIKNLFKKDSGGEILNLD